MTQAQMSRLDPSGAILIPNSVVVPGDTFSVWTDAATRQTRRILVTTVYEGDAVNVTATFKTLPSMPPASACAEAVVPAKQMNMQVSKLLRRRERNSNALSGESEWPQSIER